MNRRVAVTGLVKVLRTGAEAKASLNRAVSVAADPKPGDLSMARVKRE
jgi:hypothetical protein